MRRLPILPTLVVGLAVAAMIALGIWQLRRAQWKEGLLAQYRAGATAPALRALPSDRPPEALAFRRIGLTCRIATTAIPLGGTQAGKGPGFRNITGCALPDGRLIMADLGWSAVGARPALPSVGTRIAASGVLIPDAVLGRRLLGSRPEATNLLLVLDGPPVGLEPSVPPSIEDIPNNHRAYAGQWFLFAGLAAIIYGLALRRRAAKRPD